MLREWFFWWNAWFYFRYYLPILCWKFLSAKLKILVLTWNFLVLWILRWIQKGRNCLIEPFFWFWSKIGYDCDYHLQKMDSNVLDNPQLVCDTFLPFLWFTSTKKKTIKSLNFKTHFSQIYLSYNQKPNNN